MKRVIMLAVVLWASTELQAQPGKKMFDEKCASCHNIGGGAKVGPDLKGVIAKHPEAWLIKWIKSSQTLVKQKDPKALALVKKFNNIPMPDAGLTDSQIKEVMAYIKSKK